MMSFASRDITEVVHTGAKVTNNWPGYLASYITSAMQVIMGRELEDIVCRQACIICGCADRCADWHCVLLRISCHAWPIVYGL